MAERERKILKFRKKLLISVGLLLGLLGLIAVFFMLNFQQSLKTTAPKKLTIALVNEDTGSSFNGMTYQMGKQFVNQVSNDNTYNWEVVPEAVAQNAYHTKSVDAVIYLPTTFSQDILTFQDLNPQKAEVTYELQTSQDGLTNATMENKINSILFGFNQSIVKMYYASISGNVSNAVSNMNNAVNSQSGMLSNVANGIYPQLTTANQNYSSVISMAQALSSQNTAWINQQNSFTTSTTQALHSFSQSLNQELPDLSNYFALNNTITTTNLANANAALNHDTSIYSPFLSAMQTDRTAFYVPATTTPTGTPASGYYADLQNLVSQYNTLVGNINTDLSKQITILNQKKTDLEALEETLLTQYFGVQFEDSSTNPSAIPPIADSQSASGGENYTDYASVSGYMTSANAQEALANRVSHSFYQDNSANGAMKSYENAISSLVESIPTNDLSEYMSLINKVNTTGGNRDYGTDLQLISNYRNAFNIPENGATIPVLPVPNTTNQTASETIPITVPVGDTYKVSFAITSPNSTATIPTPTVTLTGSAATQNVSYGINFENETSASVTITVTNMTSTGATPPPTTYPTVATYTNTYNLIPADATDTYISNNLGSISTLLSNIVTASQLIDTLYGNMDSSDNLEGIPALVSATNSGTVSDFQNNYQPDKSGNPTVQANSMFYLYNNIAPSDIVNRLDSTDINAYFQDGKNNLNSVIDTIQKLDVSLYGDGLSTPSLTDTDPSTATIGLIGDLAALGGAKGQAGDVTNRLPADFFETAMNNLNTWYAQINADINTAFNSKWTSSLAVYPWSQNESDSGQLYSNDDNDSVYQSLQSLISSANQEVTSTAQSAQVIKDNSSEFATLVQATQATQSNAQKALDTVNKTVADGSTAVEKSTNYSNNFSTTLANTRANGADTGKIYDFFSDPLGLKNITPSGKVSTSSSFDWRWLLVLLIGTVVGIFIMYTQRWIKTMRKNQTTPFGE